VILVDTGVLFATADRDDPDHAACDDLLAQYANELVVPVPVAVEAAWLIESRLGPAAETTFLRSVSSEEVILEDLTSADWARVIELVDRYADLPLGTVDASVVAVAERLGVTQVATLDHRDFSVVRPVHVATFKLLP
jgi:uncharacterized protein